MGTFEVIRRVAQKELREVLRDGRMRLLGGIVFILTVAAFAFGAQQAHRAAEAREHASERSERQWQGQGKKNPHVAAHYGTHAFAPSSAATALDPGVSAFLGRAVKIEAHKRNLAAHSAAQDGGGMQRLGSFSVAAVLLQLVPLLIIALGYGVWSRERERGTLRQLLSTGVERRVLLWGKALALTIVLGALLLPAALLLGIGLWLMGGGDASTLLRLGLLGVAYSLYFAAFGGLTLYASAAARSSRAALVGLVGAWGLFCLVTPRAAAEVAAAMAPLPSRAELARQVAHSLENGLDGKTKRDVAIEAMVSDLMAAEGLSNTGMLVAQSETSGMELQAEAKWEDAVFDHYLEDLDARIAAQEALVGWFSLASPYLAMRALSAGLCGTDFAHHRHFTDYAERWRKALVQQLNEAFAKQAGAEGWSFKAGPELWKKAPAFVYPAPGPELALRTHGFSLAALLGWLLLALGLALRSARRVRVV